MQLFIKKIWWWVYAELRFIKYRIRTDLLRKPDRIVSLFSTGSFTLNDAGEAVVTHPSYREINVDENIRNIRNGYKKGIQGDRDTSLI